MIWSFFLCLIRQFFIGIPNMRRFFVVILTFLYTSTTVGVMFHVHYCMGKLESWGIGYNHSKKCGKCGMDEPGNGCCKDEVKFLKNTSDQRITEPVFKFIPLSIVSLLPSFGEKPFAVSSILKDSQVIDIPHRCCSIAVYIRNCVFRN